MHKLVRPTLYGLFGLSLLGVGALLVFGGGDDPVPSPEATNPTPPPAVTDTTEADQDFDDAFGNAPISDRPIQPVPTEAESAPVETNAPAPVESGPRVVGYKVKKGEVLGRVARNFGCSLDDIYRLNAKINKDNAHRVQAGTLIHVLNVKNVTTDVISLDTPAVAPRNAVVSTDNMVGGAPDTDAPPVLVEQPVTDIEPLPATPEPPKLPQSTEPDWSTARKHTLKRGDNYFDLAMKYYGAYSFWPHIRNANPQWKPADFEPGMVILIPALKPEDVTRPALPNIPGALPNIPGATPNPIPPMRG